MSLEIAVIALKAWCMLLCNHASKKLGWSGYPWALARDPLVALTLCRERGVEPCGHGEDA